MTRVAIISDVHGNLPALEAVLEDAQAQGAKDTISLGDIVGYGGKPNECLDKISRCASVSLMGNHDAACLRTNGFSTFNGTAKASIRRTIELLTEESKAYLATLQREWVNKSNTICFNHSVPGERDSRWSYMTDNLTISNQVTALQVLEDTKFYLSFIGHSHIPCCFGEDGKMAYFNGLLSLLQEKDGKLGYRRLMISVGSVGQPRDGDNRAAYIICDSGECIVELRRVPYDIPLATDHILSAGLPKENADRLHDAR